MSATNTAPLERAGHEPGNYNELFGLLWDGIEPVIGDGAMDGLGDDEGDLLGDDEGDILIE